MRINLVPASIDQKHPVGAGWTRYQTELYPAELESGPLSLIINDGLCAICGAVSDNLECIDFDLNKTNQESMYNQFMLALGEETEINPSSFYVEQTPSGGYHLLYHVDTDKLGGNEKLAFYKSGQAGIETRGEGGLVITALGGKGHGKYKKLDGFADEPPLITQEERDELFRIARSLTQKEEREEVETRGGFETSDDLARANPSRILNELLAAGWKITKTYQTYLTLTRPGRDGSDDNATLHTIGEKQGCLFVNTCKEPPFEGGRLYSPIETLATLWFGGRDNEYIAKAFRALKIEAGLATPATSSTLSFTITPNEEDLDGEESEEEVERKVKEGLRKRGVPTQAFPFNLMPACLRKPIQFQCKRKGLSIDRAAVFFLPTLSSLSAMLGRTFGVKTPLYSSLYPMNVSCVLIAPTGMNKSPIIGDCSSALCKVYINLATISKHKAMNVNIINRQSRRRKGDEEEGGGEDFALALSEMCEQDSAISSATRALTDDGELDYNGGAINNELWRAVATTPYPMYITKATPEGAIEQIANTVNDWSLEKGLLIGSLIRQDEISGWIQGSNYSSASRADFHGTWITILDGETQNKMTNKSGSVVLTTANASIIGGIQDGLLNSSIQKDFSLVTQGVLGRFLFARIPYTFTEDKPESAKEDTEARELEDKIERLNKILMFYARNFCNEAELSLENLNGNKFALGLHFANEDLCVQTNREFSRIGDKALIQGVLEPQNSKYWEALSGYARKLSGFYSKLCGWLTVLDWASGQKGVCDELNEEDKERVYNASSFSGGVTMYIPDDVQKRAKQLVLYFYEEFRAMLEDSKREEVQVLNVPKTEKEFKEGQIRTLLLTLLKTPTSLNGATPRELMRRGRSLKNAGATTAMVRQELRQLVALCMVEEVDKDVFKIIDEGGKQA